jgi:hypothetical protein
MIGPMGVIRRSGGDASFMLSSVTRVGRSADNELALEDSLISQFHAVVRWVVPGKWEIRDLGSRNGTFLRGVRLEPGERYDLDRGAQLSFGEGATPWHVEDVSRPYPEVRDLLTGVRQIGTEHLLTISGADGSSADVLEESPGSWQLEVDGVVSDVWNEQIIIVGGTRYRLGLPLPAPETEEAGHHLAHVEPTFLPLRDTRLTFFVSSDLETVGLQVRWLEKSWESNKAYNRALLALAEARLRDQRAGRLPVHDQGWLYGDELCTLADYDGISRLNVEVHRARSDFARQGIPGAPSIVQRRRGSGQVRLGTDRVEVVRGRSRP